MGSGIHKTTIKNINDILNLLKEGGEIHVRGISKTLNLNPFIVSNIIDKCLSYYLEIKNIDQYGFKIKLLRLKPGMEKTTVEDVLRYVKLKKKIRNI